MMDNTKIGAQFVYEIESFISTCINQRLSFTFVARGVLLLCQLPMLCIIKVWCSEFQERSDLMVQLQK